MIINYGVPLKWFKENTAVLCNSTCLLWIIIYFQYLVNKGDFLKGPVVECVNCHAILLELGFAMDEPKKIDSTNAA